MLRVKDRCQDTPQPSGGDRMLQLAVMGPASCTQCHLNLRTTSITCSLTQKIFPIY